jgi:hypothetical protein
MFETLETTNKITHYSLLGNDTVQFDRSQRNIRGHCDGSLKSNVTFSKN